MPISRYSFLCVLKSYTLAKPPDLYKNPHEAEPSAPRLRSHCKGARSHKASEPHLQVELDLIGSCWLLPKKRSCYFLPERRLPMRLPTGGAASCSRSPVLSAVPAWPIAPAVPLGGSWVAISRVISPLIWIVTLLKTPLVTAHEPPSRCCFRSRAPVFASHPSRAAIHPGLARRLKGFR